jgi:nicotinate-nucleotide pyrophosphorylase (carboxylating)
MNLTTESLDQIRPIVQRALDEDIGDGDVTTLCTIPEDATLEGRLIAKAEGIIAGLEVARLTFALPTSTFRWTSSFSTVIL